ncbi:beta-galactosidase [Vibrio sp. WXL210]|uniref:beta-galactosidase n=1 Tax=Vibrio sp. WXL210 TaxID=3450709 RepID=UPI003EC5583C
MQTTKTKVAVVLSTLLVAAYGCKSTANADAQSQPATAVAVATPDVNLDTFFASAQSQHAKNKMVSGTGVTVGDQALQIDFDAVSDLDKYKIWPSTKFSPQETNWNWNAKGSLKLDVTNPSDKAANIVFKIADDLGKMGTESNQLSYAVYVPAGETQEVEMLFNGGVRKLDGYWGGESINLRKIQQFEIFVQGPADAQTVIVDNLQLVNATGDFISAEERIVSVGEVPTVKSITNFEAGEETFVKSTRGSKAKVVKTKDGKGLEVKFSSSNAYPNVMFSPKTPWNWSDVGDFNLAFDIENPSDEAVQLYIRVDQHADADGAKGSISSYTMLRPENKSTYYLALSQSEGHVVSGMRSEPPKLAYDAQAISRGWGEKSLDTSSIYSIQLYLQNPTKDAEIIVDSIRLVPDLDADMTRYSNIVDKFGQFTGDDWVEKIHSEEQLKAAGQKELANLGNAQQMDDRCKFGGWKNGPRLDATGYFRTEKLDGKWTLVDPEGCLFFITGLDNIRMGDTNTITGMDYENYWQKDGYHVASELRNSMFEWLPEKDDPLAVNYGYAGRVHSGTLKKGEVFSFYRANLMRKYDTDQDEAMQIWKDVTLDRMVDWGFTTLGNWIDPMFFGSERVAYQIHGWINGDHKRISTGNDYWGPIHDPFDPEFVNSVSAMADHLVERVKDDDPWLVGVFVDNEISWGNVHNEANHYGLVVNALAYDANESPAKRAFTDHLQAKYKNIAALNKAWGSNVANWAEFEKSFDYRSALTAGMKVDYSEMLEMLSDKYFSIVRAGVKNVLPNHLYLGARFADWGVTPEIARGAAPHVDVMSYNLYANDINDSKKAHWKDLLPELDKPSMIGEFHFGATDTGLFHGGIITVSNQSERSEMYVRYMNSIVENPYFVGAHWFQYLDSPATGRAWDGENYNIGFITIADEPYVELIDTAKQFNADLYPKRFAN